MYEVKKKKNQMIHDNNQIFNNYKLKLFIIRRLSQRKKNLTLFINIELMKSKTTHKKNK